MFSKVFAIVLTVIFMAAAAALPFGAEGCGAGECVECHSLSKEQASQSLEPLKANINVAKVEMSEVPGLWSIIVERADGMKFPIFLDFSLSYIIQGEALKIASRENITKNQIIALNRVDTSSIPLDDALVIGDPNAKHRIIVFDDPECPFCKKIHEAMLETVKTRPDYVFFIKMLPLEIHPTAYDKAKAIICEKSVELLEKSLNGEEIPAPTCETDQIEKNRALAKKLRVRSTPTLVFPDGRVFPGFKAPEKIIELMEQDDTLKNTDAK
jgi:thiol:disulfide interchange protein DsbC